MNIISCVIQRAWQGRPPGAGGPASQDRARRCRRGGGARRRRRGLRRGSAPPPAGCSSPMQLPGPPPKSPAARIVLYIHAHAHAHARTHARTHTHAHTCPHPQIACDSAPTPNAFTTAGRRRARAGRGGVGRGEAGRGGRRKGRVEEARFGRPVHWASPSRLECLASRPAALSIRPSVVKHTSTALSLRPSRE
jgi:hypothetical protein